MLRIIPGWNNTFQPSFRRCSASNMKAIVYSELQATTPYPVIISRSLPRPNICGPGIRYLVKSKLCSSGSVILVCLGMTNSRQCSALGLKSVSRFSISFSRSCCRKVSAGRHIYLKINPSWTRWHRFQKVYTLEWTGFPKRIECLLGSGTMPMERTLLMGQRNLIILLQEFKNGIWQSVSLKVSSLKIVFWGVAAPKFLVVVSERLPGRGPWA